MYRSLTLYFIDGIRKVRVMSKFVHCDSPNQGFWLEFDNGYTLSVQWAGINMCGNKLKQYPDNTCATAEVMIIDSNGKHQDPLGWQTADQVAQTIQEIVSIKTKKHWLINWF